MKRVLGDFGALLHRCDMIGDVTKHDLFSNLVSPCVPFLPTEAPIMPSAVVYECLRVLCLPAKPHGLKPVRAYQHEIANVEGLLIHPFLLYLNHDKMQQQDLTCIDILLMNAVVKTRRIGHRASCLNILGWVFKREGLTPNALQCFIQSIREEAECNAVYWHLLFFMSD